MLDYYCCPILTTPGCRKLGESGLQNGDSIFREKNIGNLMMNDQLLPHFNGGSLQDCDLSNAALQCASFDGVTMYGSNFSKANLNGCEFYIVLAMDSSFDNSSMQNVKFFGGSFEGVSFFGADLTGASFLADNMGGHVDLSGANFENAKLDRVTFKSALYSENTKFPEGFSLDKSGLIKKEK